jgi:Ca2+-binding RTX toxin-like protein
VRDEEAPRPVRQAARVRRALLAAVVCAVLPAAPAEAAFQSCTYDAATHTVTATFGTGLTGTLSQSGSEIRADGAQCGGAATTGNTDLIRVVGDLNDQEKLTISLAGGTFAGGFTDEPGTSDEVEIELDLKSGSANPGVTVLGSGGADHLTLGTVGTGAAATSALNLNANEPDGAGLDADLTSTTFEAFDILGGGGPDVLSGAGGDGIPNGAHSYTLKGEAGDDDITTTDNAVPGPGNDKVRFPVAGTGRVTYQDAPAAVLITLQDGAAGNWGGATIDGEGGADEYFGPPDWVTGTDHADTIVGSVYDDLFFGLDGNDTLSGGAGDDQLNGNDGVDTVHGNADDDEVTGGAGSDDVFGDDGNDIVDGGNGNDDEFGGDGDDQHRQSGYNQFEGEEFNPNGADDVNGGPGTDSLEYGEPGGPTFGFAQLSGRTAPVTVDLDDVADDGAAGENDNAHSDIEDIVGGVANDTLTGDGDANVLSGFDGADVLRGGGGDDTLKGLGSRSGFAPQVEADVEDDADDIDGGPGADTVDANEGADRIEARDDVAERIDCGPGVDTGRADRVDTLNADCELDVPPAPATDPPVTPIDPPITPPVAVPPVVVPPVVTPPAPKVAALLSLPSSRRCASRRKFTVRVRREIRGTVKRVTIFLNGRRVKSVTGSRIGLPIDLRGLPKGKVKVRLRVELLDGRVATDTRTYRTCATKKRRGQFGRRRG